MAEVLAHTFISGEGRGVIPAPPVVALQSPAQSAGPGSTPPRLPAFLLQSLGTSQHPGITSAPRRREGGLVGWASSFP